NYDPRTRPWYIDAFKFDRTLITGPYIFYATGSPGYTLRIPLREGRRGVAAGDILLNQSETMLAKQRLGQSGTAFLFNDDERIVAHPQMSELTTLQAKGGVDELPRVGDLNLIGLTKAIKLWKDGSHAPQFFRDDTGRNYVAAFQRIETAGNANVR